MNQSLTTSEASQISAAIAAAESGTATLSQLCRAHALAEKVAANKSLGLLRYHIHRITPQPLSRRAELKSVLLGVISGTITWFLLGRRGGG